MKKLFPLAIVAVLGILMATSSCQKNPNTNDTNYCYCGYKDSRNEDSAWAAMVGWSAVYSYDKARGLCQKYEDSIKMKRPTISCQLD